MKNIKFDERYDNEDTKTTTLYFTAPKEILDSLYPYDYSEASSAEISIELPTDNICAEDALVSISPTLYDEEEDAYTDYDWTDIELPFDEIEELIKMVVRPEELGKCVTCIFKKKEESETGKEYCTCTYLGNTEEYCG